MQTNYYSDTESEYSITDVESSEEQNTTEIQEKLNIYKIRRKNAIEIAHESSLVRNKIEMIATGGELLSVNAEKIVDVGINVTKKGASFISKTGLVDLNLNVDPSKVATSVEVIEKLGDVAGKVSKVLLIAYIGYKLYEEWKNDVAQVIGYNMCEWGRVNIKVAIPKRPNPKFCSLLENKILKKGELKYIPDSYYGILLFIFSNFIYNIDVMLDKFLDQNKEKNFTSAYKENNYAKRMLEKRKAELCYGTYFRKLIEYYGICHQFPLSENSILQENQIKLINKYIQDVPKDHMRWSIGSIACLLFKTMNFAVTLLENGQYKFSDYYKMELLKYAKDKNQEFISENGYKDQNIFYNGGEAGKIYVEQAARDGILSDLALYSSFIVKVFCAQLNHDYNLESVDCKYNKKNGYRYHCSVMHSSTSFFSLRL